MPRLTDYLEHVENLRTREMRHVSSAYVTYVAMDANGVPQLVDPIVPETEHQKRRYDDALRRREGRADETRRKREMRKMLNAASSSSMPRGSATRTTKGNPSAAAVGCKSSGRTPSTIRPVDPAGDAKLSAPS